MFVGDYLLTIPERPVGDVNTPTLIHFCTTTGHPPDDRLRISTSRLRVEAIAHCGAAVAVRDKEVADQKGLGHRGYSRVMTV